MAIKHQAFLDLEAGMAGQLGAAWGPYWRDLAKQIKEAVEAGDWDRAHELVDTLNMAEVLEKRKDTLHTFGMAALLLGASRVATLTRTSVYNEPPEGLLSSGVGQASHMIAINGTEALRRDLHAKLDNWQREVLEVSPAASLITPTTAAIAGAGALAAYARTVRAHTTKRALSYLGLAASLHVSRMSNAGFFVEATTRAIQQYQINEVMDSRTCGICKRMHGKTFSVVDGYTHMVQVLQTDPSLLALVDPWPKQTKQAEIEFKALSDEELRARNFHVPPFHPLCRGIVVPHGEVVVIEEEVPVTTLTPFETAMVGMNPNVLMGHLFGIQ